MEQRGADSDSDRGCLNTDLTEGIELTENFMQGKHTDQAHGIL
jgi:hypothetical protein